MELSFNTRLSVAFLAGISGLIWQGVIATLGGNPSDALIGAFTTVTLATIGIGLKNDNKDGNNSRSQDDT